MFDRKRAWDLRNFLSTCVKVISPGSLYASVPVVVTIDHVSTFDVQDVWK